MKFPIWPIRQGSAFKILKVFLVSTILIFALAAGYMSLLIFERQESLSNVSRYDVSWSASQGFNEFIRLYQRVTALANEPTAERRAEVKLRFEILKGRLDLFERGAFLEFARETQHRQAVVKRFSDTIQEMEGLIKRIDEPEAVPKILSLMAPLEADLIGLASEAAYFTSLKISDFEQDLLRIHRNFSLTALGFVICGLAFVALLGWHNRLLTRTHTRLESANSDLQQATTDLAHMARHDLLTGLPNRLLFREYLQDALIRQGDVENAVTIMCLDLDNFKNVNDTLGHPIGDDLLREVAARLTNTVGSSGMVARLGGDEFVIVLESIGTEDATALANSLINSAGSPYDIDGHHVVVGTSVGIAQSSGESADPDLLLRNADLALYRAKGEGRGNYRFFDPEMDAQLQRKRNLELALHATDFDADFVLLFQPLVDLRTKRATTVEVLCRWPRSPYGAIAPDEFIPLAEDSGIIVPLGAWVLNKACATVARLPTEISVAVNVSAIQFRRSNMVETISSILSETGLAPNRLELEITETLLLDDSRDVRLALNELRSLGIRVSLDDFGKGYSSLAYLRKFAVDKVKIDRSFVAGIDRNPDHLAIVQAIVGLTHALGMVSVAEGVETEEQLLLVSGSGCDEAQGYFFSRPASENKIKDLVTRREWELRVA